MEQKAGAYAAECPEVGIARQGYTIEEAVINLKEATVLYLEEFPVKSFEHPLVTTVEIPINVQSSKKESAGQVITALKQFRAGHRIGNLSIREMIEEGRR